MDTDMALRIIDQLAEAGVDSITWTGGGEPTLHPDFDKVIIHTTGKLKQGIYTHGGHIDGWRAELLKTRLEFVYVSLDAADAASYKAHKGVDRFGTVCKAIQNLSLSPEDGSEGATIGVGYLVTRDNWRQAGQAADLVLGLGADYIQFRPTIMYDQKDPNGPDEDTSWIGKALAMLLPLSEKPGVEVDLDRFRMYRDWDGHGYPTCWWSALQTCITPNGKVWTCVNKREHPGAELGDLSVESFADVWARRPVAFVTHDCRVMCRGHLPNLELAQILQDRPHAAFV